LIVNGSDAAMGLRGSEKGERKREWLERWLRDYAELA